MYGPVDSSATHISSLATLLRQLEEIELCEWMVPSDPTATIWHGAAKALYCTQLAELRVEIGELRLTLGNVVSQFQTLAAVAP